MIGVALVSHGQLASEILRAAEIIVGKIENIVTVDIHPKMGMEEIHRFPTPVPFMAGGKKT